MKKRRYVSLKIFTSTYCKSPIKNTMAKLSVGQIVFSLVSPLQWIYISKHEAFKNINKVENREWSIVPCKLWFMGLNYYIYENIRQLIFINIHGTIFKIGLLCEYVNIGLLCVKLVYLGCLKYDMQIIDSQCAKTVMALYVKYGVVHC